MTAHPSRVFAPLADRNYRLFWCGQVFSLAGNWMETVGEGWLVYRLTGSPLALGLVGFVSLLPVVPVSLFGGALIDRLPKRKLLLLTQPGMALAALLLALLTYTGAVRVWHVILVDFVFGLLAAIDLPARQAFVADLVERDRLAGAIALNNALFNAARLYGPLLAGLLVAVAGEAACFLANALSFVPFVLGLLWMRNLRHKSEAPTRTVAGQVVQGLGYIWRDKTIVWLLAVMGISSCLLLAYVAMLPVIARDILHAGPQGLGILTSATGAGAVLGSLWLAGLDARRYPAWLILSLGLLPFAVLALTLAHGLVVATAIIVFVGISSTWMQTLSTTLVQLFVRDEMRGRTMSLYVMLSVGMQKLGGLQVGLLAELTGVPIALRLGALVSLAFAALALWLRPAAVREIVVAEPVRET